METTRYATHWHCAIRSDRPANVFDQIRLFGDPQVYNLSNTPTLSLNLSVEVQDSSPDVILVSSHEVVPDIVDGWAFGEAVGVSLRSTSSRWWTVTDVVSPELNSVGFSTVDSCIHYSDLP